MVRHFAYEAINRQTRLNSSMLADRKRVFVDTLKWDLFHNGVCEVDQFDDEYANYLILSDHSGAHKASTRLLPTTVPHMLSEIFPYLCERGVPRGSEIMEITRFLLSPRFRASERLQARNKLVRALIEFAQSAGVEAYTAVCELAFLSQVLSAGWRCTPLGLPQKVDGAVIGAFMIHIEPDTIERMTAAWSHEGDALKIDWGMAC